MHPNSSHTYLSQWVWGRGLGSALIGVPVAQMPGPFFQNPLVPHLDRGFSRWELKSLGEKQGHRVFEGSDQGQTLLT